MKENKRYGNIYDRIFKENAESLFLILIEQELNIKIIKYKILQEKLPKTLEREVDFLYEIILADNSKSLLHIEFQTRDDNNMINRMAMYHGLAYSKYKLPVNHVVIYLGKGISKMKNKLSQNEIFKGFDLINLNILDPDKLISSQIPEIILLGLLANYKKERSEAILRLILKNLKKYSKSKSELKKYHQQLIILARLRKLDELTIKLIENMPIEYDIKSDYLFNKGIEIGEKQGLEKGERRGEKKGIEKTLLIINLIKKNRSIPDIIKLTGCSVLEIEKIQQLLNQ